MPSYNTIITIMSSTIIGHYQYWQRMRWVCVIERIHDQWPNWLIYITGCLVSVVWRKGEWEFLMDSVMLMLWLTWWFGQLWNLQLKNSWAGRGGLCWTTFHMWDWDTFQRIFFGQIGLGIKIWVWSGSGYFLSGIIFSENFWDKVESSGNRVLHSPNWVYKWV